MNVKVNSISGYEEAIVSMFISKRTWTPELDSEIRRVCSNVLTRNGSRMIRYHKSEDDPTTWSWNGMSTSFMSDLHKFESWMQSLIKMGKKHITVLRFLTVHMMTEGMHRGGQDDIDAHVKRFENKFIRSSTRLATFSDNEVSDFYKGKILTDGQVCNILGYQLPAELEYDKKTYVKSTNGYVLKEYADDNDVKRGLYMLSIPSNFVSEISICEYAHVYKQRNELGHANPEVKQWAESVMEQITKYIPEITKEYMLEVEN